MITKLDGQLEIDHERGVIYFHLSDEKQVKELETLTVLRICRLPKPIPEIKQRMLDVTHMVGCDWGVESLPPHQRMGK